ncbi:MAG: hypothetical protein ABR517_05610 [Thermoanaerobaculia bacterium]
MRHRSVLVIEPRLSSRIAVGRDLARLGFASEKALNFRQALGRLDLQPYAAIVARLGSNQMTSAFAELLAAGHAPQLRKTILLVEGDAGPDVFPRLFRLEPYAVVSGPSSEMVAQLVSDCLENEDSSGGTRWIHADAEDWQCRRCFGHFSNAQLCANVSPDECRVHLRGARTQCHDACTADLHDAHCLLDTLAAEEFSESWCDMFAVGEGC